MFIMKRALVLGAGGFIGNAMVTRLKSENYWVRGVDLKNPEFSKTYADEFIVGDLRNFHLVDSVLSSLISFDEIYQFAADMGGAEFIFSGENDASIMHNSALINLNVLEALRINQSSRLPKIFYSSSACIYPEFNQVDPANPITEESTAYPANPDSEYGWEKLFSERLYLSFARNYNIDVAIARYHNIFGPFGTWEGGREKAPAAFCRKISRLPASGGNIEVWGDGKQTRSFLYIDDCIDATRMLMKSNFRGPVNIGSEEMVTINQLIEYTSAIAGKKVTCEYKLTGPLGVRGRNSHNKLIQDKIGWSPKINLYLGLEKTYSWIENQINQSLK
jgi:nucleoside-diphosphate-sugar epimerase